MKPTKHLRMVPSEFAFRPTESLQEKPMSPLPQHVVTVALGVALVLVVTVVLSHHLPSGVDPQVFITTTLDHVFRLPAMEVPSPVVDGGAPPLTAA